MPGPSAEGPGGGMGGPPGIGGAPELFGRRSSSGVSELSAAPAPAGNDDFDMNNLIPTDINDFAMGEGEGGGKGEDGRGWGVGWWGER